TAAGSDDAEELAGVSLERDPVEREHRAPVALEGHGDVVDNDFGKAWSHRCATGRNRGPGPSQNVLLQRLDPGSADLRVLLRGDSGHTDPADQLAVDDDGQPALEWARTR